MSSQRKPSRIPHLPLHPPAFLAHEAEYQAFRRYAVTLGPPRLATEACLSYSLVPSSKKWTDSRFLDNPHAPSLALPFQAMHDTTLSAIQASIQARFSLLICGG